ncbi:hypothetical protein, partial [Paenibacillus koleovorans]|uniref:hypothetical protein n=1 Tax=Paenibacillus koleovorans TaxID=121608 RepID=UPI001C3FBC1E
GDFRRGQTETALQVGKFGLRTSSRQATVTEPEKVGLRQWGGEAIGLQSRVTGWTQECRAPKWGLRSGVNSE